MFDQIRSRIGRRGFAAAGVLLLALLAAVATPQILGTRVAQALHTVGDADPRWLWLAGLGFAASLFGAAASWRCAIGICGGRVSMTDACARYGAGSLVNTLVPARAGDAVRIGLFARALPNRERLWTTGGAFAALSAAKAGVLGAFVVAAALTGAVPLWPLLIAVTLVATAVAVALFARRHEAHGKASHLLDAFRALGREPRNAARLVAWVLLSAAARLTAATAILASLGITHPFAAAIVIVAALDVTSALPLTPGNLGITSGAVAPDPRRLLHERARGRNRTPRGRDRDRADGRDCQRRLARALPLALRSPDRAPRRRGQLGARDRRRVRRHRARSPGLSLRPKG